MPRGIPKARTETAPDAATETDAPTAEATKESLPTTAQVLAGTVAQDREEVAKLLERVRQAEGEAALRGEHLSEAGEKLRDSEKESDLCREALSAAEDDLREATSRVRVLEEQVQSLAGASSTPAGTYEGVDPQVKAIIEDLLEWDRRGNLGRLREAEGNLRRIVLATRR